MKVILLSPPSPDRKKVAEWLGARGYAVAMVTESAEAVAELSGASTFAVVDLAVRQEAVAFLRAQLTAKSPAWTVALADRRDAGATGEALRLGAIDIVSRPLREADVIAALSNAREFASLTARKHGAVEPPPDAIFSSSPRMREIYEVARRVAASHCPILIVGERGTGCETLGRHIHRHGTAAEAGFWKVTSGPSGAHELREVLKSDAGTVYIEDVAGLPLEAQSLLEGFLQQASQAAARNGHVRVIATARPGVDDLVERNQLRHDLFNLLAVVRLEMPTLRQRPQDIPPLAMHFLKEACRHHAITSKTLSRSALALLASLAWRGNASELKALIERLALLVPRGVLLQEDVLQHVRFDDVQARGGAGGSLRDARKQFEREFIASTLQRHQWRIESAASELGIERTNLYRKMKQLSIIRQRDR